jgi:hypothetical protein
MQTIRLMFKVNGANVERVAAARQTIEAPHQVVPDLVAMDQRHVVSNWWISRWQIATDLRSGAIRNDFLETIA